MLDEPAAVRVAVAVDPLQARLDVRPDRTDEVEIAGALVPGAGEDDVQRCGIGSAVTAPERDLSGRRHLPASGPVQDLAGLRALVGFERPGLGGGEVLQHAATAVGVSRR
jgi:hypothetical protein